MDLIIDGHKINLYKRDNVVFEKGGLICVISPWASNGCPLTMEICITPSGNILFRGWDWSGTGNVYLHVVKTAFQVNVTEEMKKTVAGLFSGRITVEGLQIPVGASIQEIVPIDLGAEEQRTDCKIYLA